MSRCRMRRRGRDWGERGEKWRRRKGERKSWGVLQLESTITGEKKKFCVLKTKTTRLYFKTKIKLFELKFPCFAWNMSVCSECYLTPTLTYATLKCTPLFNTCKHNIRNIFLRKENSYSWENTSGRWGWKELENYCITKWHNVLKDLSQSESKVF